jgi:hypothetical protein
MKQPRARIVPYDETRHHRSSGSAKTHRLAGKKALGVVG